MSADAPRSKAFNERPKSSFDFSRKRIIQELIETEKTYHHQLDLIVKYFETPLRLSNILSLGAHHIIFSNILSIVSVNQQLLQSLINDGPAAAFLKLGPFLKIYTDYVKNHQRTLDTLQENEKNPKFVEFRRCQELKPELGGLKLNALLITPVQRIPRYKLLLENLLEHTNENDPTFDDLCVCVDQISEVASHINEHIRQYEQFQQIIQIQRCLSSAGHNSKLPKLVAPGRYLVKQGQLNKVSRKNDNRVQIRTVYLFNDLFIYARPSGVLSQLQNNRSSTCSPSSNPALSSPSITSSASSTSSHNRRQRVCAIRPIQSCIVDVIPHWQHDTVISIRWPDINASEDQTLLMFADTVEETLLWGETLADTVATLLGRQQTLRRQGDDTEAPNRTSNPAKCIRRRPMVLNRLNCGSPIRCNSELSTQAAGLGASEPAADSSNNESSVTSPLAAKHLLLSPSHHQMAANRPQMLLSKAFGVTVATADGASNSGIERTTVDAHNNSSSVSPSKKMSRAAPSATHGCSPRHMGLSPSVLLSRLTAATSRGSWTQQQGDTGTRQTQENTITEEGSLSASDDSDIEQYGPSTGLLGAVVDDIHDLQPTELARTESDYIPAMHCSPAVPNCLPRPQRLLSPSGSPFKCFSMTQADADEKNHSSVLSVSYNSKKQGQQLGLPQPNQHISRHLRGGVLANLACVTPPKRRHTVCSDNNSTAVPAADSTNSSLYIYSDETTATVCQENTPSIGRSSPRLKRRSSGESTNRAALSSCTHRGAEEAVPTAPTKKSPVAPPRKRRQRKQKELTTS